MYYGGINPVEVKTRSGKVLTLKILKSAANDSYYYELNSPAKSM